MKNVYVILVLILLGSYLFGSELPRDNSSSYGSSRDNSSQLFTGEEEHVVWSGDAAKDFNPLKKEKFETNPVIPDRNYTLIDSVGLDEYLPASHPFAYYHDVYFDRSSGTLNTFTNDSSTLTESAEQAIQKSPLWMRARLKQKMKTLNSVKQDYWAEVINNASDPYVDEIAFAIATLSPTYLYSQLAEPEVIITNAEYIYINDVFLDYVEVVDYGNSLTDENYYTTVRYTKMNESGEFEQVEVPREIYYWDIAHPRITGEIPAFVDPTILEYNHQGNIVDPDEGFFWRDYLFNHVFNDTLNLRNMMAEIEYVWDGIGCAYPGGDWFAQPVSPYGDDLNYALHIMAKWINGVMQFTSPGDRPHQPVRIAHKGMGRCGEYALLTTAVGRSLLLPTTNISNWFYVWDHTFNEMWLEGWEHYEPYYWEWGETFYDVYDYSIISSFETRSDGLLTTVTEHYVDYSTINITILDENDNPVDGSKVKLYVQRPDEEILQSMYAYSDNNGLVHFTVSDGYDYFARAESAIGDFPLGGVALLVSAPVAGETYNLAMNIASSMPEVAYTIVDMPPNTTDEYKVVVDFDVPEYAVIGSVRWDDLNSASLFSNVIESEDAHIDFFVMDELNSNQFLVDLDVNTVHAEERLNSYSYELDLPDEDNWHFIFSNKSHINTHQYLKGSVKLYQYSSSANQEEIVPLNSLSQNYPNPFNPSTTIKYQLTDVSDKDGAKLQIYNLKGQKVRTFSIDPSVGSTSNSITWDGTDENNMLVSSGIYMYKLIVDNKTIANKKMLLLK